MKYQFSPDYTSYHVAVYDTLTGDFIKGVTHQGYADNTMWEMCIRDSCTTLHDYMRFLDMIYHNGVFEEKQLLKPETIHEMQAHQVGNAEVHPGEYVERAKWYRDLHPTWAVSYTHLYVGQVYGHPGIHYTSSSPD